MPTITARVLRNWRGEALRLERSVSDSDEKGPTIQMGRETMKVIIRRVLGMTQELLDQHLLNKG
jgi:hypothetical protein